MAWELEATDEFQAWWKSLSDDEKAAVDAKIRLLEDFGPALPRPHADTLSKMSKHANMKELRIQHAGDAYRVLFAFDPRRVGVLLLGGQEGRSEVVQERGPESGQTLRRISARASRGRTAVEIQLRRKDTQNHVQG